MILMRLTTLSLLFPTAARAAPRLALARDGSGGVVVAEHDHTTGKSVVHVYQGARKLGAPLATLALPKGQPDRRVMQLVGLGDVEGDGFADLLVVSDVGAYVYHGGKAGVDGRLSL